MSIADSEQMVQLASMMIALDGAGVVKTTLIMMKAKKHSNVRAVCLKCARLANPKHCQGLIDNLVPTGRKCDAKVLSSSLATIMAGIRERSESQRSIVLPNMSPARIRDVLRMAMEDKRCPVNNIGTLPAKPGKMWTGLALLVSDACRLKVSQEGAIVNTRFERFLRPDQNQNQTCPEEDYRMAVIWTYSRNRRVREQPGLDLCEDVPTGFRRVDVPVQAVAESIYQIHQDR